MGNCKSIVLAEQQNSNVVKCPKSGLVRWYFKNFMVAFEEKDFISFSHSFSEIDFLKQDLQTSQGIRFVIINTCHQDIQFVFNEFEHKSLEKLFQNARYELEIYNILKT